MSDREQIPAFTESGDTREEALWQAYQAMLRRRNEPRARPTATDGPPIDRPESALPAHPPPPARSAGARRIEPRQGGPLSVDPGPLSPHLPEPDVLEQAPPPARLPQAGAGRRAALGVAVVLAGGAALAVALWPRGPGSVTGRGPGPVTPARSATDLAPRPTLPCFVNGQLIGDLTLDDCVSRNGVASGALDAGPVPQPGSRLQPAPRGAVASLPIAAAPPPALPPAPFVPLADRVAASEPRFPRQPPPRVLPVPERYVAEAASAPPAPFGMRALAPSDGYPPLQRSYPEPSQTAPAPDNGERGPVELVSPTRASALAVREFYRALGEGDGARAAEVVVPEKRAEGPLSAGELTRFYSSLRAPLRLTQIDPINDNTVFVRYQFVTADNRLCSGSATVATARRDGDTLVRAIRAFNGC